MVFECAGTGFHPAPAPPISFRKKPSNPQTHPFSHSPTLFYLACFHALTAKPKSAPHAATGN
jgi:hypothetical protein